ncbi:adenosine deaminase [Salinisphaera sp. Q1T1-3]|uniref:adenosine deaminase n=1 Tax=Salinisphaera sp. Q1T1-3 TaxID=2321229 RepID=UPI000E768850|nr:adenosine deaminase [Salinisphaera sp. Q1T1-3]RJS93808.1 adenosine deaminase [Salinisphaera sp. Q1T1-3]
MNDWLTGLPKAELHLHIEGTLTPHQQFALATRNGVTLPYDDAEALQAAYEFDDLSSFLALYYQGMNVLLTRADFYDLAMAYFERAAADGVRHVDLSFDPQAHVSRGVALADVFEGLRQARQDAAARLDVSSALIMSFMRDRDADDAMTTFKAAAPWHHHLSAIGLDSAEVGNPPEKFTAVFERARAIGLPRVAHAGEEGGPEYVRGALDALDVCRIDHGVRAMEDDTLIERLRTTQTPLTVCPLSNLYLKGVADLADHNLPLMLEAGLNVNINSDDPAYFGGGMVNNFAACVAAFDWDRETCRTVAANGIRDAFMPESRRAALLLELARYE